MPRAIDRIGIHGVPVMRDVARLAGVSHQTVSRVLNESAQVSPEARERVQRAVEQLGYRRNTAARALVTRRSMKLGVVGIGTAQYGPAVALFSIAEYARQRGYSTSLVGLDDIDRRSMREAIEHLVADPVDGIVVFAPLIAAVAAVEGLTTSVPLVLFEPGGDDGSTVVAGDEVHGARLATRHLLSLGHETVCHLSGPAGWLSTDARSRGWAAELAAARRAPGQVVVGDWSSASGYDAAKKLLRDRTVSALFVANDQMALGALRAAAEMGRSVTEDLSVVGFDDIPEAAFFTPSLTTIRLDFAELGRRCVQRLLGLITSENLSDALVSPPELAVRRSTAAPHWRHSSSGKIPRQQPIRSGR